MLTKLRKSVTYSKFSTPFKLSLKNIWSLFIPRNVSSLHFAPSINLRRSRISSKIPENQNLKPTFSSQRGSQSCVSSCTICTSSSTSKTAWNCSFGLLLCRDDVRGVAGVHWIQHFFTPYRL